MGTRSTIRRAAQFLVTVVNAYPVSASSIRFYPTLVGKASDPSWNLDVAITEDGTVHTLNIADDSGKVRKFGTIDAVVKAMSQIREVNDGNYQVNGIQTGAAFASKVPANIYADAAAKIVRLNKVKLAQVAKSTALGELLTGAMLGWDSGNAAQQARYLETETQKDAIDLDVSAIDAKVIELQGVVESDPDYVGSP